MGWGVGLRRGTEKPLTVFFFSLFFFFFYCWGGWHYHKAVLAGCRPQAELSSTCFYDRWRGDRGVEGAAWHRISINSGAGNVSLSLFLAPSHIAPLLFFSSGVCLSFLCAILIPLSALCRTWIFHRPGILSTFNGVHILYIALSLVSELPSSPPLSVCHPLGLEIGLGSNKVFDFITITCKSKYI